MNSDCAVNFVETTAGNICVSQRGAKGIKWRSVTTVNCQHKIIDFCVQSLENKHKTKFWDSQINTRQNCGTAK